MSKKIMMLAASAMAALAFAALPAIASANPEIDLPANHHFTSAGGASELQAEGLPAVKCATNTGSGEFTSSTTGTVQFTFHGCKAAGIFPCNSANQPEETIQTGVSQFHLVTVTEAGIPGALITPPENGVYATFNCGVLVGTITVTGNGILGEVTEPGYNTPSNTFTLNFASTGGKQAVTTIVGSETEYTLKASLNGATPVTAGENASGKGTFAEGGKGTLTE